MMTRKCSKCKAEKSDDYFYNNHLWCTSCMREKQRLNALAHPEYLEHQLRVLAEKNKLSRKKANMHGIPWSKNEDDLIRECWAIEPLLDIAEVLGRTYYSVKHRAKVLGIRKTKAHPTDQ